MVISLRNETGDKDDRTWVALDMEWLVSAENGVIASSEWRTGLGLKDGKWQVCYKALGGFRTSYGRPRFLADG